MSMIVFLNTATRFLRDQHGKLAVAAQHGHGQNRHRGAIDDWRDDEERHETGVSPLLFTGLVAALYVATRIGLSYVVL